MPSFPKPALPLPAIIRPWGGRANLPTELASVLSTTIAPVGCWVMEDPARGMHSVIAVGQAEAEPLQRRGDVSHAGVWVQLGEQMLVSPCVLRVVCLNVLSLPPRDWRTHDFGSMTRGPMSVILNSTLRESETLLRDFVRMATLVVEDAKSELRRHCQHLGLDEGMTEGAVKYLMALPGPLTLYDLINAMTGARTDSAISEYAGQIVRRHASKVQPTWIQMMGGRVDE